MKLLIFISIILNVATFFSQGQEKTLYDFSAKTIDGQAFDFSTLRGKKVLIVNIATTCSLAPQLNKMQSLYEEYGGDDFEIIAFPCNDFGNREPGNNAEIKKTCENEYHITFQLMEKIHVKGDSIHPLYQWLTSEKENGVVGAKIRWNYQKYLINPDGMIEDFANPWTGSENRRIVEWIMGE